ncbi:unnamed protein product [Diabrotica balteata]|uniref:Ig-like domain-containing protein n=1 Tax=Diabrotica balteata TaxID=107213 RepID=A0A9N9XE90_DIABA|nr:unnamed protein product [Diabrotica balteata]
MNAGTDFITNLNKVNQQHAPPNVEDGLLPSGHQVETGYLLNLNEVQRQDAGVYQCTASNGIGQPVTGEIKLHVLCKSPEVSVIRSWVNAGEGGEAKLDCVVHADPPAESRTTLNNLTILSSSGKLTDIKEQIEQENPEESYMNQEVCKNDYVLVRFSTKKTSDITLPKS